MEYLIARANNFAREAHRNIEILTVSGNSRPYTEHLQEVADLVWASGGSDIEIAAAWLHDCVEDTLTTLEDIKNIFGDEVSSIVDELTDSDDLHGLSIAEYKPIQAERIKRKSVSSRRIKIADQISNIRLFTFDPKPVWTVQERRDYVIGAKMIADNCAGVSLVLDDMFEREYVKSKSFFGL